MTAVISTMALSLAMLAAAPQELRAGAESMPAMAMQQVVPTSEGPSGPAATAEDAAAGGVDAGAGEVVVATGLPRRAAPPRTMEAHWPIFALFVASWIGIAVFLLLTGRRSARLVATLREREVRP